MYFRMCSNTYKTLFLLDYDGPLFIMLLFYLCRVEAMAGPGRSMLYSLLLFAVTFSLLEMYRGKLASSELLTIAGGFISSLLFVLLLTVSIQVSFQCRLFSNLL